MDFVARWAFSYVPLWGHPTLANPDLAAIQGRTERVHALDTRAAARTKLCTVLGMSMGFLDKYIGGGDCKGEVGRLTTALILQLLLYHKF